MTLFDEGNALFKRGEIGGAVAMFTRALELEPLDEKIWSNRCAAHLRLANLDAAEADAARTVELAPRWHKAHYRVGRVQHDRGELVGAWESYYAAHVFEPEAPLYTQMMAAVDAQVNASEAPAEMRDALRELKLRILTVEPMAALTAGDPSKRLPVTVLSGFLGAGKSSVLRHVLTHRHGLRVAVIVNDFAELNIDAALLKVAADGTSVVRSGDRLVELSNGCICCTLREDLLTEVAKLCLSGSFDAMLIESSGISEPTPVAQTFLFEDLLGRSLSHLARLDTLVTVVDSERFSIDLQCGQALADRGLGAQPSDTRRVSELLLSQLECADVLILNKTDRVSAEQLALLGASLRAVNPGAQQLQTQHGVVPVERVLCTGLFDWRKAMASPGWLAELSASTHASEADTYGVRSFVYRRSRPFDARRLDAMLKAARTEPGHPLHPRKLLRSKGFWWLAQAPALRLEWATAATDFLPSVLGCWLGALASAAAADPELVARVAALRGWDARFADRKVEVVFIGVELEPAAVERALDLALCDAAEEAALLADGQRLLFGLGTVDEGSNAAFAELTGPAMAQLGSLRLPVGSLAPGEAHSAERECTQEHEHAPGGGCGGSGWPSREPVEALLREELAEVSADEDGGAEAASPASAMQS